MNVGIIGTGLMGYPMAENISKNFKLKSYNRTFQKMKGLEKFGINLCKNIEDIFKDTDIVITMLPGDEEVLEIVEKATKFAKKESIIIDMSSTKVSTATNCYKTLKENQMHFLDSPVSGGPEGAKNGSLAIMVGGDQVYFNKAQGVLKTMGNPTLVGPNGSGQVSKLCNQIIVGITIGAVAEAITLAEKYGADPKKFIDAVSGGFADSRILQNHGNRMIARDFKARGKNITHLKDMKNILEQARISGAVLPISKIIHDMFENLCYNGLSEDDHSSIYKEINKIKN